MKTLDDALLRTATQRLVAEFQPEQIWLYGSHAWGNPHDDSDVDLLVRLAPGRSLLDLVAIKQDLEDLLGCSVDVVTEEAISTYLRPQVLKEVIVL